MQCWESVPLRAVMGWGGFILSYSGSGTGLRQEWYMAVKASFACFRCFLWTNFMSRKEGWGDLFPFENLFFLESCSFNSTSQEVMLLLFLSLDSYTMDEAGIWELTPTSPMSLKKFLSLYEVPIKMEKLSSRKSNKSRPNTIVDALFGQRTTCMEKHKDWLNMPQWEMGHILKMLSAVQTQDKQV